MKLVDKIILPDNGGRMSILKKWLAWLGNSLSKKANEIIDETSKESFPASDPPAWAAAPDLKAKSEDNKNNPVHILKEEHQLIMQNIYMLHEQIEQQQKNQQVSKDKIKKIIAFMHRFVHKSHHQKEETHLLPALEQSGAPIADASIDDLKWEREQALNLISILEKSLQAYTKNEPGAREQLLNAMIELKDIYIRHIIKEENIIFPLVEKYLSKAVQKSLLEEFEKIDSQVKV